MERIILKTLIVITVFLCAVAIAEESFDNRPWVVDIEKITLENDLFLTAKWTGNTMQMTLMSIPVGGEIGLEMHDDIDQFIRIESGIARVMMGEAKDKFEFDKKVEDDWAIFIPGGYWHNVINIGDEPLKLYSIYAPPEHPAGATYKTFEEAEAAHAHDH